jgi:hypothetical protein
MDHTQAQAFAERRVTDWNAHEGHGTYLAQAPAGLEQ